MNNDRLENVLVNDNYKLNIPKIENGIYMKKDLSMYEGDRTFILLEILCGCQCIDNCSCEDHCSCDEKWRCTDL